MNNTELNDRYKIEVELGQGGMGTVYRGYDNVLKRDVAIKVLSESGMSSEVRERLLSEARLAARLNHPNIVAIHDASEVDGMPFIVMEYVDGQSLFECRPEFLEEIVSVARGICAALEHAHEHGIVHRDLKPENVLRTPEGTVKLTDFGLARSVTTRMTTEGLIGTLFYLAPELALGQKFDGRADLYALGVMLYEMTTGELPFNADDPLAVISQHIHAPVVPPRARDDGIPPALDALILRLLSKDPTDRPTSATEVINELASPKMLDQEALPTEDLSVLDRIARGRLIGRQGELEQALGFWQQATCGAGQLLMVSGDPGIGKTRLRREIATHVDVTGGQVLVGECHEGGNAPYTAFAQIARRGLRIQGDNGFELHEQVLADLLLIAPELRLDHPGVTPNPRLEPEAEQRRLLENMVKFCTQLSERAPLLLVIEDLHWSDSGSLYLWCNLARRMKELPVMLLGTYREVELDEALPFHEVLLDLNRQRLGTRLKLERLDRERTRQLLSVIFAEEITPDFLDGIYKETEGNPFFIEELCKALVESGEVYYVDGKWDRPSMEELILPQGVKVTIQSRTRRLTPETQEVLLNAAVIGREFDYRTLQHVTEKDEETLIDSLEEAIQAQLVEELKGGGGERFTFSHAMVPAVLRESISGLRRNRLHRKVALAIEWLHPQDYERLANHWGEAGDEERTLEYTIKAAERARQLYANHDAVRLYSEALGLLPEDHLERFSLLEGRARVYDLLAEREEQLEDVEAMLALAEKQGDDARRVDALLALTQLYLNTEATKAKEPAEQALEIARELDNVGREGRALHLLGTQAHATYDVVRAYKNLSAAVECLRLTELRSETAKSMSYLSVVMADEGDDTAALETALEAVTVGAEVGDKLIEATTTRRLAIVYSDQYKPTEALPVAEAALQMFRELGDVSGELHALNVLSFIKERLGRTEEAETGYLEMLKMAEAIGQDVGIRFAIENITGLYLQMGEYEKALVLVEEQLEKANMGDNEFLIQTLQGFRSNRYYDLGKFELAGEILETNLSNFERVFNQGLQALVLSDMGLAKAELGAYQQAHLYLQSAVERCAGIGEPTSEAVIQIISALAAVREGKTSVLQAGLEEARGAVQIMRPISAQKGNLGWALYAQASLHLALLEVDASHAEQALACTTEVLQITEIEPQVPHPERYLFLHSRALRAVGREAEADETLCRAYEWMMMAAGKIKNEDLRQSYLENVVENRELAAEYEGRGMGVAPP